MKYIKFFLALTTLLLTTQCTWRKTAMTHSAWVLKWEIFRSFDLNKDQRETFAPQIDQLVASITKDDVPVILGLFDSLDQRLTDGLQPEDLEWASITGRTQRLRLFDKNQTLIVSFLMALTPDQIDHFETVVADRNAKAKKLVDTASPEDIEDDVWDEGVETWEDWYGSLDENQITELKTTLLLKVPEIRAQLTQKLQAQARFVTLLRSKTSADDLASTLRAWLDEPALMREGTERVFYLAMRSRWSERAVRIAEVAGPKGMKHLRDKLSGIAHDLQEVCKCHAVPQL